MELRQNFPNFYVNMTFWTFRTGEILGSRHMERGYYISGVHHTPRVRSGASGTWKCRGRKMGTENRDPNTTYLSP